MTRRLTSSILRIALALGVASPAAADPVTTSTLGWAISGIVSEVARAGDVAYVGGSFDTVSPSANLVYGIATFSTDSAAPVLPRLDLNGRVRAVVAHPGGGWIIGGEFTHVNGAPRGRLARLLADGTLDAAFTASANSSVRALAIANSRLYVGGSFSTINSETRDGLAAIDLGTGTLDAAFVPSVQGGGSPTVGALAVSGGTVYFGGSFNQVNGASQQNLGAVNLTTGATVAAFTATADGSVNALQLDGASLYAAGTFHTIGGESRDYVARLDLATGAAVTAFNANVNGEVSALVLSGATLYVGGSFGQAGGASRAHIAAVDAAMGTATAWNPGSDGDVCQLGLFGTALVAAGSFHEIGGAERLNIAALDTSRTTDITLPWNPSLNRSADFLHVDAAGFVFAGGDFNFYGSVLRQNLAAIDLLTGDLLPWNPGANGWIRALDVRGNTVYIGGDFTTIGGVSRSRIAALDGVTGVVSSWTANPNGPVFGLMVSGDVIYFVGNFTGVKNSTSRGRGAAVNVDGTVQPWNPSANDEIEALFVSGERVYLGGTFTMLGGLGRSRLGAVDATTGTPASTFTPSVDGPVYRVDVQNDLVYFGGGFSSVNGSTRSNAAAVKAAPGAGDDGQLQGWNPNVGGPIYDLDAFGQVVYLAGGFGSVNGSSRPGIAMVDSLANGGALRDWQPEDVNGGAISVIDTSDTAVLFGGLLYDSNNIEVGAVLYPQASLQGAPRPPTTPTVMVRGGALRLEWEAPPLGARPAAYVIEGGDRPGATNLANFSTGNQDTSFSANGLPAGTYYVRMRSRNSFGSSATTREQAFVVGAAGCSGPPSVPLDQRATVTGSNVSLAWRTSPESIVTGYRLLVGTASGVNNAGVFNVGPVTTFSATAPTGAFFVRLLALNACGVSAPSAEAAVIVGTPTVPPGPAFALEGRATGSTVSLEWGPPSVGTGPFQYRLEAGTGPGLTNAATISVPGTTFATTGVPRGIYYVRVRAIGPGGTGPASNEVVITVP
jgi:hypothetical protein